MSQASNDIALNPSLKLGLRDHLQRTGRRLAAYRPRWNDRRFWILQALTIGLATLHAALDFGGLHLDLGVFYFLPASLLLVPVVFAALTYGFVGAIATTLWAVALTVPDMLFAHPGPERMGIIAELLLLGGIASVIGRQVDRERLLQAETASGAAALKASTMKYQGLLETNPIAVLVVSPSGAILEANTAASILFGKNKTALQSLRLFDLLESRTVDKLLGESRGGHQHSETITLKMESREIFLETRITESDDGKGHPVIQVLLRDVTDEYHRRAGLRAFAAEVLWVLEEERQLMARELHDETIQSLILLSNQVEDAEEMAAPLSPPLQAILKEAHGSAETIVKGLRNFAKALRPPALDDLGIAISIRRLLADFGERTKIEGQLTIVGNDRRLPSNVELGVFRIAQEALRNVERHAGAKYVAIIITFTGSAVRLDVVDNGVGFSVPSATGDFTASCQLGLISMQERAQLLGGRLEIQSSPGKGTRVTVFIPDVDKVSQMPSHHLDV